VNFSGGPGIRPVPGFPPPGVHVTAYSRESTPDSGGSHYMDAYRDPTGKLSSFIAQLSGQSMIHIPKTLYDPRPAFLLTVTFNHAIYVDVREHSAQKCFSKLFRVYVDVAGHICFERIAFIRVRDLQ